MTDPGVLPVAVKGFTWTAGGAWASFFALAALLIRQWVPLKKLGASERRNDIDELRDRVTLLEGKVEVAQTVAHQAELKLVSALAAYRLIASELQKLCPDSPILRQAQELLNVSYPSPRSPADTLRTMPAELRAPFNKLDGGTDS